MRRLFIAVISLSIVFSTAQLLEARRGCCSHHGGVCGCRCCDGTSLSAKCAPYYPDCPDEKPSYKSPEKSSYKKPKTNVIKTQKSAKVYFIQSGLKLLGYYNNKIDGVNVLRTKIAIENLQKANGITSTGLFDEATKQAFFDELAKKDFTP